MFFCHWDESDIRAVQDQSLIIAARKYKEEIDQEWAVLRACMLRFPDIFEEKTIDEELFLKVYAQVCTRCFDLDYGRTAMIPMADNYNHYHNEVEFDLVNKSEHLETSVTSPEFVKDKFMNDYSLVFDQPNSIQDVNK